MAPEILEYRVKDVKRKRARLGPFSTKLKFRFLPAGDAHYSTTISNSARMFSFAATEFNVVGEAS